MIQAETIVHFYYDIDSLQDYEAEIVDYLNSVHRPLKKENIISIGSPFKSKMGFSVRVVAKLQVFMEERRSTRHLDDYVSFVFPTVKRNIKGDLISTQNLHLKYYREEVPPPKKKVNWEELYHHWND
ncbi:MULTISPECIES: hypothetical protein [Bacillaceae]|uniref:Uncharacterized protein n=1 Tax=Evansella alkalicola TaxID=745819 RepID=A0ABS6JNH8_9BACI|nr:MULTISPECIES: hypothetical protein [Bacillaceae]MBU9720033.1 hypothetical protein [Bacillus alkalicola]